VYDKFLHYGEFSESKLNSRTKDCCRGYWTALLQVFLYIVYCILYFTEGWNK